MNFLKKNFVAFCELAILFIALLLMILDWALADFNVCSHPIFTFLLVLIGGTGIVTLVLAYMRKSPWYFLCTFVLLGLALMYVLIWFAKLPWWIVVICYVVLLIVVAVLSFLAAGSKTENIALNKSSDYKNYEERKAEKEQAEKDKPAEELPKIKSFKE